MRKERGKKERGKKEKRKVRRRVLGRRGKGTEENKKSKVEGKESVREERREKK